MTVKAVAATGQLGTGFSDETLAKAAEGADFIGCDAGSTDPGPYYLGSGRPQSSRSAVKRDLRAILRTAVERHIPVVIGSAGTAGGRPHLQWTADIVREVAKEEGLHFALATIDSEIDREMVVEGFRSGRVTPLEPAPKLTEETIRSAERVVAMMGVEPFQRALAMGAQVIVGGRASDTSIYAALPMARGIPAGVAFHAGKILECGAAAAVQRLYPDCMTAELSEEGFVVEPPNPRMACTPQSVVAHSLYENADPFHLVEPGGVLDISRCRYEATSERSVRVTGSTFLASDRYTVRLEGASLVGYRSVAVAGIRDPLVLRRLDEFLDGLDAVVREKVRKSVGLEPGEYHLQWRVYGKNGAMGPLEPVPTVEGHEVGLLIDVVAPTQAEAAAIVAVAWHTGLHHPVPEYGGLVSNFAFPFSPPGVDVGPTYRFCLNHVLALDDPVAPFPIHMEDL